MSKKLYSDAVFFATGAALASLSATLADASAIFGTDPGSILRHNLPAVIEHDEAGNAIEGPAIGYDAAGNLAIVEAERIGSLALIYHYADKAAPNSAVPNPTGEGEPLLRPTAIYLINLPKPAELWTSPKLNAWREETAKRQLLAAARKLAKGEAEGKTVLVADRIGALLTAAARSTGSSAEKSFTIMFPFIQGAILARVAQITEQLKAAKRFGPARAFEATYSRARLNRDTLREVFASVEAAEYHFPQMPQDQWNTMLKFAIARAPKFAVNVIVKDEAGKSLKHINPETGKEEVARERKELALSPAIFEQWLATRADTRFDRDGASEEGAALTFDGMTV